MRIAFTCYGEPVAKARPKFSRAKGFVRAYTPKKSKEYEDSIAWQAIQYKPDEPLPGALALGVRVYRSIPKSWSKKKKAAARDGSLWPVTKPDLDNYIKAVKDALNSVIWVDDAQVIFYLPGTGKYYSSTPRVEVVVEELI